MKNSAPFDGFFAMETGQRLDPFGPHPNLIHERTQKLVVELRQDIKDRSILDEINLNCEANFIFQRLISFQIRDLSPKNFILRIISNQDFNQEKSQEFYLPKNVLCFIRCLINKSKSN